MIIIIFKYILFWTFYLLKNPEKKYLITVSQKILSSTTVFNIDNEPQNSISEWFLRIMWLKTEVMMLKITAINKSL